MAVKTERQREIYNHLRCTDILLLVRTAIRDLTLSRGFSGLDLKLVDLNLAHVGLNTTLIHSLTHSFIHSFHDN